MSGGNVYAFDAGLAARRCPLALEQIDTGMWLMRGHPTLGLMHCSGQWLAFCYQHSVAFPDLAQAEAALRRWADDAVAQADSQRRAHP